MSASDNAKPVRTYDATGDMLLRVGADAHTGPWVSREDYDAERERANRAESECGNLESALRGEQGYVFEDGYEVNIALLREQLDRAETAAGESMQRIAELERERDGVRLVLRDAGIVDYGTLAGGVTILWHRLETAKRNALREVSDEVFRLGVTTGEIADLALWLESRIADAAGGPDD